MGPSGLPSREATPVSETKNTRKKNWEIFLKTGLILIVILLIVVFFGFAYVAAATGFTKVPIFSRLIYKEPTPARQVQAEELNSEGIKKRVQTEFNTGKVASEVYITEQNLTSILSAEKRNKLENAQVALIDNGKRIEIFGKLKDSDLCLLADFTVSEDSENNLKIGGLNNFQIGSFKVPSKVIGKGIISESDIRDLVGVSLIEKLLSNNNLDLNVSGIELQEGKIIEKISLSDDKEKEKPETPSPK